MRCLRLFCAIGVGLWSAVVAGNQAAPVGTMPDALRAHVKAAAPGRSHPSRGTAARCPRRTAEIVGQQHARHRRTRSRSFRPLTWTWNPALPTRRLAVAAAAPDFHCLVYYERGGKEHLAGGAVSVDTVGHSIRVGRHRPPGGLKNKGIRRCSKRSPFRSGQEPQPSLVILARPVRPRLGLTRGAGCVAHRASLAAAPGSPRGTSGPPAQPFVTRRLRRSVRQPVIVSITTLLRGAGGDSGGDAQGPPAGPM